MRRLFPSVRDAVARVLQPNRLRWISFGHFEADECGAINAWLAIAPNATRRTRARRHRVGRRSGRSRASRAPGRRDSRLGRQSGSLSKTPHVPHGQDAGLLYEETTATLFAGDLFTATGDGPATTAADIVGPAVAAEDLFGATALTPMTAPTIRRLADFGATTLALMHAPAYTGDARAPLHALADDYASRLARNR